jgi:hypothetical protein
LPETTVTPSVVVPAPATLNAIEEVPCPPVIVPFVMVHAYEAPPPAFGTDAVPLFELVRQIREGAAIAAETAFTTAVVDPAGPVQPLTVAVTE